MEGNNGIRIWVLGDGPNEVAKQWQDLLNDGNLPPLAELVHRLLGCPSSAEYRCGLFRRIVHGRGKGDDWQKKLKTAIEIAQEKGYHAIIVVRDRDRKTTSEKLKPLEEIRDCYAPTVNPACALGLAIEAFDAWMICDENAIEQAGGDKTHAHPQPEKLHKVEGKNEHPKDRVAMIFGALANQTEHYRKIAVNINLDILVQRCPKGFAPFAREVRDRIGSLVSN